MTPSAAAIKQSGVGDCVHAVRAFDALALAFGGQRVLNKLVTAVNGDRARMKVAINGDSAVITLPGKSGSVRLRNVSGHWLLNQSLSSLGSSGATASR